MTSHDDDYRDAHVSNEDGPVSYQWSILWQHSNEWIDMGTNSSQSVTVASEENFTLRVEVHDNDFTDDADYGVMVQF